MRGNNPIVPVPNFQYPEKFFVAILQNAGLLPSPGWFPTYPEFFDRCDLFIKAMQEVRSVCIDDVDISATLQSMYINLIIHNAGTPHYHLSPDLVTALVDTEIPNFTVEFLKLPFEGINLHGASGMLPAPADKIDVLQITHVPGDRFRVVAHLSEMGESIFVNIDTADPNRTILESIQITKAIFDETNDYKSYLANFKEIKLQNTFGRPIDLFNSLLFKLAVNSALYLSSPDPMIERDMSKVHEIHRKMQGLKRSSKRNALEEQLKREKERKIYIVGKAFRLPVEYTAHLTEEGRKVSVRHRVQGHWKAQPVGPNGQDRKSIYISPYWRGPTMAEMVQKGYIVR